MLMAQKKKGFELSKIVVFPPCPDPTEQRVKLKGNENKRTKRT